MVWLANQYIAKLFRLEDAERVSNVIKQFTQAKSRLPQKDINQYTFRSLEDKMDEIFSVELGKNKPEQQTFKVPGDTKVLYNGPLGLLVIPETHEASCILGKGTKWCTTSTDSTPFDEYTEDGPLYIWRDKNGEKYQFHFASAQFMDSGDNPISHSLLSYFRKSHPILKKLFKQGEETIIHDPEKAASYAINVINGRWPEAEPMIIRDSEAAYLYAKDVLKGRWPEAEPKIMKDLDTAYRYAKNVIKGRWPEAEPIIMQSPKLAYAYARDVLKGRWPEAEPTIMGSAQAAYFYARDVIKGRWPEAEPIIAPQLAYEYARDVLKGRWPEAEKYIRRPGPLTSYATDVIKGRWPEAEPIIATSPYDAFRYARDVLKGRFPAGEKTILSPYSSFGPTYRDMIAGFA